MAATRGCRTLRPDISRRAVSALFAGALLCFASENHARAASPGRTPIPSDETPLERAQREYPPTETNAAAIDAERLAAPLGINLVPDDIRSDRRPRPGKEQTAAFEKLKEALPKWLKQELEKSSGKISPLPEDLDAFLESHTAALAALRGGILRGEEPVWTERLELGEGSPHPKLIGHIYLQQLLLTDALRSQRAGRRDLAAEILEASWRLNHPNLASPFLQSHMVAQAVVRFQAGMLRRLDVAPGVWSQRLRIMSPVDDILDRLRLEALLWPLFYKSFFHLEGPFAAIRESVLQFYVNRCAEEAAKTRLERLDRAESEQPFCDRWDANRADVRREEVSWWNKLGWGVFTNSSVLLNASRVAGDIEMTVKILDLRTARDENHGRWPDSLHGIESSQNCPQDHYIYEAHADGRMRLELSRRLEWGTIMGTRLPTTYREDVPTASRRR